MGRLQYTVVIPAFNAEETIGRAVTSALSQNIPPSRVIVVDDASTDLTKLLALEAGATVFTNTANLGSGRSRLVGVGLSKTPLVGFLDADDTWDSNLASKSIQVIRDKHADIVGCQLRAEVTSATHLQAISLTYHSKEKFGGPRQLSFEDFLAGSPLANSGTFSRTSVALKNLERVTAKYAEDFWYLILNFTQGNSIWLLPEKLGSYRLSSSQKSANLESQMNSRALALDYLLNSNASSGQHVVSGDRLRFNVAFSYWAGLANIRKGPPGLLKLHFDKRMPQKTYECCSFFLKNQGIWWFASTMWRVVVRLRGMSIKNEPPRGLD
jgi:glycosyltransferase involved in cell wall biosynthesis